MGDYDVLDSDEEIPGRALWLQAVRGAHGRAARACCPNGFGRNEVRLIPSDFSFMHGWRSGSRTSEERNLQVHALISFTSVQATLGGAGGRPD